MDIDRWIARWEGEGGALPQQASSSQRTSPGKTKAITLREVLVPIDFSPESLKALRYAKPVRKRFGAGLHLVHVVTPPSPSRPAADERAGIFK